MRVIVKFQMLLSVIVMMSIVLTIGTAIAQEDFIVTVGAPKTFTEFNVFDNNFSNDPGNVLPWPAQRETISEGNLAKVSLIASPGQAGQAQAWIGVHFNWNLGQYQWEDVKNWPVKITFDFTYNLTAIWELGYGSSNAGLNLVPLTPYWYKFIGYETGLSGTSEGHLTQTFTTSMDGRPLTVEVLSEYGNSIVATTYSQAHLASNGINTHNSLSSITINNIKIEFDCDAGADTDHDGLLDCWETNGIDFDKDGIVDLDLPAMGADPLHKDIFVEIDYMVLGGTTGHTHKPKAEALQRVIDAFNKAPVSNPDGTAGIHIHIDAGPDTIMNPITKETWGKRSQSDALIHQNNLGICTVDSSGMRSYDWGAFDVIKGVGVPGSFSTQRADVFHYNIWGHSLCPEFTTTSGISRGMPASDFLVTLGGWSGDIGTVNQQAGTLMHELGHGLSFSHGGNDHENYKPNYISIMNYAFQTRGVRISGLDGNFDYSRFQLPSLNEAHLNETIGLSGVAGTTNYGTRFYDRFFIERIANNINGPIDWNWDGDGGADTDVSVNVNRSFNILGSPTIGTLGNADNWKNIVFTGGWIGNLGENNDLPVVVEDPDAALVDITEPEDANIFTDFSVSVIGPFKAFLAPAQSRIYTYKVTNTGDYREIFNINAVRTQEWANISEFPFEVSLDPNESTTIAIEVNVPVGTVVGSSDLLTVTVRSTINPAMMDAVETTTFVSIPTTKDQCKDNDWMVFGFRNQGQCIQFFNTGM